jgi:hypothetical protein
MQVFPNNIMPANAAAWYMAKRKFYANQPLDQQLLAFLLKKYPDKFRVNKFKVRPWHEGGGRAFINLYSWSVHTVL